MQMQNADMLITRFAESYMEKLFYFCLKKTGNSFEAEDLSSDISLNIFAALRKGTIPANFPAWVWRIARNRYSVWVDSKHKRNESVTGSDIGDFELADDISSENEYVHSEDLSLLRRELAFISSDYRDIVVAFYIEDRSIKDIAALLRLPEGTVKSKLFRARNLLKEGISMAREFGTKSYKPEDVRFAASGSQPSGLPWRAVDRKIPKNILLSASNNPLTIEELAIELGVAVPYMEEEVNLLVNATLLKKLGNKYITNFYIADKNCQLAIYTAQRQNSKERSDLIDEIVSDSLPAIRSFHIVRNNMTDAELKWWLVIHAVDFFVSQLGAYNIYWPEKRDNGESWGFIGFEKCELPENCVMGHNGNGSESAMFWAYKISDYDLWNRAGEMNYNQAVLLADLIENSRKTDSLSDSEKDIWERIDGRFAHADENGNIVPDILVLENNAAAKVNAVLKEHPLYDKAMNNIKAAFDKTIEILKANCSKELFSQLAYCASMMILDIRMMTIHDEVKAGKLIVPNDPSHSTIAMYLEIK